MMKGSVEVSIGFLIVMIVAALSMIFIMGWMGNLFPTLQDIGDYATANARTQMMEEFGKGAATILATVPNNKDIAPGSNIKFLIGVKKQASVDDMKYFNMCVSTIGSTSCQSNTGTPVAAGHGTGTGLDTSGILFSYQPTITLVNRGDSDTVEASMQVPSTVKSKTTYGFVIYACAKKTLGDICTGIQDPNYYGMYDFQITVK